MPAAPHVLVLTIVHHPEDARIRHRQIEALLAAGWQVTYAAPFQDFEVSFRRHDQLNSVDMPRAQGRRRLRALLAARKLVRKEARRYDLILLHDPELLLAVAGLRLQNVVWDVHEDTSAAIETKKWLPNFLRKPTRFAVRMLESWAERKFQLLLAEYEYQERFSRIHTVVPNSVRPSPARVSPGRERVVYLGSVTEERGTAMLVEVGRSLLEETQGNCALHVIGPANDKVSENMLQASASRGELFWHGFLPQDQALPMLDGALAGVSFLQNVPNYRHSMPTKVLEYMAHGIPVVATGLPLVRNLLSDSGGGILVGFEAREEATAAILRLYNDPELSADMASRGYSYVTKKYNWNIGAKDFVNALEQCLSRPA